MGAEMQRLENYAAENGLLKFSGPQKAPGEITPETSTGQRNLQGDFNVPALDWRNNEIRPGDNMQLASLSNDKTVLSDAQGVTVGNTASTPAEKASWTDWARSKVSGLINENWEVLKARIEQGGWLDDGAGKFTGMAAGNAKIYLKGVISGEIPDRFNIIQDRPKGGVPNPFEGKTQAEIDKMFKDRGFILKGTDPATGRGQYINPETGRKYHIDQGNLNPGRAESPHVDVHRPTGSTLPKRKFPF